MKSKVATPQIDGADPEIRAKLIRICGLSENAVSLIRQAQRSLGMRFGEAAMHLGLVTQEEIDAARAPDSPIAVVPQNKLKPLERILLLSNPYSEHSEGVRALRTELLLRREEVGTADFVTILSPCPGEGRSLLAAELAIAFAQLDQATLLVDADLRNSSQHVLFGADNQQGLADAVAGNLDPYLHMVEGTPSLSVLTAGSPQSNPLELLSDGRFERIVKEWRRNFAFVVLDTAPIDTYSDGLAVASLTGRVLALSRAQHTPNKSMNNMLRRLGATQSRMLGAVINHF